MPSACDSIFFKSDLSATPTDGADSAPDGDLKCWSSNDEEISVYHRGAARGERRRAGRSAADLGYRHLTRRRPTPRRSTTGPASISAPMSAARSPATTISPASPPATTATAVSSAACRPALTGSSPRTGWSASKASIAGCPAMSARCSRAASPTPTTSAALGSITGRVGYTWGPGLVYVKGGYAYSDNNETVTVVGVPVGFATDARSQATATPSASASNTCSRRTGRPRPSTSTTISATPASPRRLRWCRRHLHHRRPCHQGRRELPLQLGRPGRSRATDRV